MDGRVHSIETCGTVDGPGIRFLVFMQGCNLRCKYCHNRDTWDLNGGTIMTAQEILKRVKKYVSYVMPTGGITFTGGEPLLQIEFLKEVCALLKKENMHIVIDTSGAVDLTDDVKEIINLVDLLLVDIKHMDSEKCKELTGYENEKELEFISYLNKINKPIWIRYVLVPGVTDSEQDISKLKEYLKKLNVVKKVEILPYHNKGMYKWGRLNKKYEFDNIKEATDEDVKKVKKILNLDNCGII